MTDEDGCEHILGDLVRWVMIEMLVLDEKECP